MPVDHLIFFLLKSIAADKAARSSISDLVSMSHDMGSSQWDELYSHVYREGLGGYFYKQFAWLKKNSSMKIPERTLIKCKNLYHAYIYSFMLYTELLHSITSKLQPSQISFIPLKGISLLETLYPDPGLRLMGDLDILIQKKDIDAADALLVDLGCRHENIAAKERYRRFHRHYHYTVYLHNQPLTLELHWALPGVFGGEAEYSTLWREGAYQKSSSIPWLKALNEKYLMAVLLIHTGSHGFGASMKWLLDLSALENKYDLDAESVADVISRFRSKRVAFFASALVERIFYSFVDGERSGFFRDLMRVLSIPVEIKSILYHMADPSVFYPNRLLLSGKYPAILANLLLRDDVKGIYEYTKRTVLWKLHLEGMVT